MTTKREILITRVMAAFDRYREDLIPNYLFELLENDVIAVLEEN